MATVEEPVGIIDIGSNSVRLVVYAGALRVPAPIFNEKVLAGLKRFKLLMRYMAVKETRVLATAAVREAEDGAEFVREIRRTGLDCEVLSAEEEAWLAGEGVLSAIPDADGIVGDLGGGSLELVQVADGAASHGLSLPLGVLRLKPSGGGEKAARQAIRAALKET